MTKPYHPVFPEGGWKCPGCSRSFGYFFKSCPYCLKPRAEEPPCNEPASKSPKAK